MTALFCLFCLFVHCMRNDELITMHILSNLGNGCYLSFHINILSNLVNNPRNSPRELSRQVMIFIACLGKKNAKAIPSIIDITVCGYSTLRYLQCKMYCIRCSHNVIYHKYLFESLSLTVG